jgi:hypothetical protein
VLLDELQEEDFDVGFGVLVVVLYVNLELVVFFFLPVVLLVFDPGSNGQIAIKLEFPQQKMRSEVLFDNILSASGAEDVLTDHVKTGLLNFVHFPPEH